MEWEAEADVQVTCSSGHMGLLEALSRTTFHLSKIKGSLADQSS